MYIEQLSVALQEQAKSELNEIPSQTPIHLQHIKDWLKEHPEIHSRTDDLWLLNFLRGCKFSLKKTKSKLEYFHKVRFTAPKFFANRDPLATDLQDLLDSGLIIPLAKGDQANVIVRFKNVDPKKVNIETVLKGGLMTLEIFMHENSVCMVSGFHIIIDYAGFNYSYLPQFTPSFIKKMIYTSRDAYPLRIRGIHFLNIPTVMEAIIHIAKPLLSKEMGKLYMYKEQNLVNIFEIIPKYIVPAEYGGDHDRISEILARWKTKVESYREWFLEDERYYPHLKQAPEIKDYAELEGNLKKLELD